MKGGLVTSERTQADWLQQRRATSKTRTCGTVCTCFGPARHGSGEWRWKARRRRRRRIKSSTAIAAFPVRAAARAGCGRRTHRVVVARDAELRDSADHGGCAQRRAAEATPPTGDTPVRRRGGMYGAPGSQPFVGSKRRLLPGRGVRVHGSAARGLRGIRRQRHARPASPGSALLRAAWQCSFVCDCLSAGRARGS